MYPNQRIQWLRWRAEDLKRQIQNARAQKEKKIERKLFDIYLEDEPTRIGRASLDVSRQAHSDQWHSRSMFKKSASIAADTHTLETGASPLRVPERSLVDSLTEEVDAYASWVDSSQVQSERLNQAILSLISRYARRWLQFDTKVA